jgi:hypothetical protein
MVSKSPLATRSAPCYGPEAPGPVSHNMRDVKAGERVGDNGSFHGMWLRGNMETWPSLKTPSSSGSSCLANSRPSPMKSQGVMGVLSRIGLETSFGQTLQDVTSSAPGESVPVTVTPGDACASDGQPLAPRHRHLKSLSALCDAVGDVQEQRVTVRNSQPANWHTPQGVWKMRQRLEPKMPGLRNARFITLTLDPSRFRDSESGYEAGKRHMREFLYRLDQRLEKDRTPFCWKLEFHRNGWPHWHLIFLHRRPVSCRLLLDLWGLGRVEVQRIKGQTFDYLFKYASKELTNIPDWVLDRKIVRFFQASPGFYTLALPSDRAPGQQKKCVEPDRPSLREVSTIGERIKRWARSISISAPGVRMHFDSVSGLYAAIVVEAATASARELTTAGQSSTAVFSTRIHMQGTFLWQILRTKRRESTSSVPF